MHLIHRGNDPHLSQGLTYYEQLVAAKSPFVHMQVIEGSYEKVNETFMRIVKDARHKDI